MTSNENTANNSTTINNNHDLICSFDTDQKPQFLPEQKYFAPSHDQSKSNFGDFLGPESGPDYTGIYSTQNATNGTTSPYFSPYQLSAAAVIF